MAEQQRYMVLKRLASGKRSEVFLAESYGIEGFRRRVAIKRLLPQLSRNDQFVAMFLDEARLSGQMSHSNIVTVFDIGVGDGSYFVVMEYVDGADLKAIMDHRRKLGAPLPVEQAAFIALQMCQGLAYAHELTTSEGQPLQIIHRNVTPANVLLTKHGELKIGDFGLAKAASQLAASEQGVIKGQFGYIAPETVLEQPVDHRVDVFAVGIIAWEMLAGRRLFLGKTDYQTVRQVMQAVIPPIRELNPDVPEELEPILLRSLARDQNKRYFTARELGRDLAAFLHWWGRPACDFDIAELVHGTMGLEELSSTARQTEKIAELIDTMLLEFKSLSKDEDAASISAYSPEGTGIHSFENETSGYRDEPLGGLADALEGPDDKVEVKEPAFVRTLLHPALWSEAVPLSAMQPEGIDEVEPVEAPIKEGWFRGLLSR